MKKTTVTELLKNEWEGEWEKHGVLLYDIEDLVEDGRRILRVLIEKEDGAITIEDCERVNEWLSEELDRLDPIDEPYYLEVSSVGADAPFTRRRDFVKNLGRIVEIALFQAYAGKKLVKARLEAYEDEIMTLSLLPEEKKVQWPLNKASSVRLSLFDQER